MSKANSERDTRILTIFSIVIALILIAGTFYLYTEPVPKAPTEKPSYTTDNR
ncbi:hypothetical protein KJ611_00155 [Patescibacteria group bacterium]|nr:hypothetical protein [Patescibacteria group bacterium]MBU1705653.1 hypothetical protein [Patescibacteria group bacterium]